MNPPPPPGDSPIRSHMREYFNRVQQLQAEGDEIRRLKREIERKKLEQELAGLASPTKPTQGTRKSLDFYAQQIAAWFNRLPPEARAAPRTMEEFLGLLVGRKPGRRPHAPEVSRVLLELGWKRRRNWQADGEGRRLWWPPNATF